MKNIVKDLKENCVDCSVDELIDLMQKRNYLKQTAYYYGEIWYFYRSILEKWEYRKKAARIETCEMFGISESMFFKIIKNFH